VEKATLSMERNPMEEAKQGHLEEAKQGHLEEASKDIFTLLHHNNQLLSKNEVSEQ